MVLTMDDFAPPAAARPEPTPVADPKPGSRVCVVFWRSVDMPDGSDRGAGDFTTGRVVTASPDVVVFAPDNPHLPVGFGDDGDCPAGSAVRFADSKNVYADPDVAADAARRMKPPARR